MPRTVCISLSLSIYIYICTHLCIAIYAYVCQCIAIFVIIYTYTKYTICIWDVWTCILDVWTCILDVWTCILDAWTCILGVWTCFGVSGLVCWVFGVVFLVPPVAAQGQCQVVTVDNSVACIGQPGSSAASRASAWHGFWPWRSQSNPSTSSWTRLAPNPTCGQGIVNCLLYFQAPGPISSDRGQMSIEFAA